MLNVYLAGEIHSNWREEIIQLCEKEKLDVKFTSPVTDHEASDNCGVEIHPLTPVSNTLLFILLTLSILFLTHDFFSTICFFYPIFRN